MPSCSCSNILTSAPRNTSLTVYTTRGSMSTKTGKCSGLWPSHLPAPPTLHGARLRLQVPQ